MATLDLPQKSGPKKKRRRKKRNFFIDLISGLIPWKGDKAGDVIRKLIFMASLVILVVSALYIIDFYFTRPIRETQELEGLYATLIDQAPTQSQIDNLPSQALEEYAAFYEANEDFIGWINVPHTNINYPVVQGDDNEFYLKHNFDKEPREAGAIFADYRGTFSNTETPHNIILYGHNLRTRNYFTRVLSYKKLDFFQENPIIYFDTLYSKNMYKIFAVFQTNSKEEHGELFDYYNKIYFENRDEFNTFVSDCIDRSYILTQTDLKYGDELITLSTCDFSNFSDLRCVVVARKIRSGELPAVEPETVTENPDKLMYKAWYDTFGGEWGGRKWDTSLVEGLEN